MRTNTVTIQSDRKQSTWTTSPRRALLIDLDNITIRRGQTLSEVDSRTALEHTIRMAGPVEYTLAVAPTGSIIRLATELAALGLRWQVVALRPNEADYCITRIARELVERGFREVCIASCDHHFARIAHSASLTVISPIGEPVSKRLTAAATRVHRLPYHPEPLSPSTQAAKPIHAA